MMASGFAYCTVRGPPINELSLVIEISALIVKSMCQLVANDCSKPSISEYLEKQILVPSPKWTATDLHECAFMKTATVAGTVLASGPHSKERLLHDRQRKYNLPQEESFF